jgi:hypothetical protein
MLDNNPTLTDTRPPFKLTAKAPAALDPAAYHSFAFALREDAAIWTLDWVCIGTHADIPDAGDLLPFTVGDHALHVQRAADGGVVGRFNQAQHGGCRSVPLQCQQGVKTPCSFTSCGHSLDRRPLRASDLGEVTPEMYQYLGLRPERLLPVRTASLGPLLFVNLNPVGEAFDDTSLELAQALPMLTAQSWVRTDHAWIEYSGNWKLVGQSLVACAGHSTVFSRCMTFIQSKQAASRRSSAAAMTAVWGFPNLVMLARPGSLCVATLQPVATNRTLCRVSIFSIAGESGSASWLKTLRERTQEIQDAQRAIEAWGTASDSKPQADSPPFADKTLGAWIQGTVASSFERLSNTPLHTTHQIHIPIGSIQ